MIIDLTKEETAILKLVIEHNLEWAKYKTKNIEMPDDEKNRFLKDIEILGSLMQRLDSDKPDSR